MGHQTVGDGEDSFELIAVGICGQGYADEWESNLSVGTGKNPTGFSSAAHLVYDRVFGYILLTGKRICLHIRDADDRPRQRTEII